MYFMETRGSINSFIHTNLLAALEGRKMDSFKLLPVLSFRSGFDINHVKSRRKEEEEISNSHYIGTLAHSSLWLTFSI